MSKAIVAVLMILLGACVGMPTEPRPEFPRRAAPPPGQYEIALLAGISGRLAIVDGCLGIAADYERDPAFVTLVWPANAVLETGPAGWQVENRDTGERVQLGGKLIGSGGFSGGLDAESLRDYNRMLTSKLSANCAAKGVFSLNRDFRPG